MHQPADNNKNEDWPCAEVQPVELPDAEEDPLNDSLWTSHGQRLPDLMDSLPDASKPRRSFRAYRNSNVFLKKHNIP